MMWDHHHRSATHESEEARRYAAEAVADPCCPWCTIDMHWQCRRTIPGNTQPCVCGCEHGRSA